MKRLLSTLLVLVTLGLCVVCVLQWVREDRYRANIAELAKLLEAENTARVEAERKAAEYEKEIERLTILRAEVEAKFDIPRINREVLESQQARHMMFEALKRGNHFPWDFQPLRDASEQYTRNHMSVTDRDLKSRFPHAPDIEDKRRK